MHAGNNQLLLPCVSVCAYACMLLRKRLEQLFVLEIGTKSIYCGGLFSFC